MSRPRKRPYGSDGIDYDDGYSDNDDGYVDSGQDDSDEDSADEAPRYDLGVPNSAEWIYKNSLVIKFKITDPAGPPTKKHKVDLDQEEADDVALAMEEAQGDVEAAAAHDRVVIDYKVIDDLQYFEEPDYDEFQQTAQGHNPGSSRATVVLGPGGLLNVDSDAASDASLPALAHIKLAYPGRGWVAGHMLNARFGGPAVEANLTALTSTANATHKGFDNNVVKALEQLRAAYVTMAKLRLPIGTLKYGIRVEITASDDAWTAAHPGNLITTGLTCEATVEDAPDLTALINAEYPNNLGLPTRWQDLVQTAEEHMAAVDDFVDAANGNGQVDNT